MYLLLTSPKTTTTKIHILDSSYVRFAITKTLESVRWENVFRACSHGLDVTLRLFTFRACSQNPVCLTGNCSSY